MVLRTTLASQRGFMEHLCIIRESLFRLRGMLI